MSNSAKAVLEMRFQIPGLFILGLLAPFHFLFRASDSSSALSLASLLPLKTSLVGDGHSVTPRVCNECPLGWGRGRLAPRTMRPLPPLHPAGRISAQKPALGLLCAKGGNLLSPGLPGSGREVPRETENNYHWRI